MPTQRDVQRLQALREAKRRGMLGPTQSAAVGVLENRFSEYFKGVGGRAKSVVEPAMTMASSMVAEPLSGLAGIAGTILPGPQGQGADWVERTQDALTYMPRSESGMQGLQGLTSLMQPVGDAMQAAERGAGDFGYERFGPGVGAMMAAIPAGIAEAAGVGKPGRIAKKFGSASDLMTEWNSRGIKSFVSERPDKLVLDKIIVPDGARGQGLGSQAMQELAEYADQTGKRIELSPSADFGGNKKRLTEFYKRQGFVENKGKNKDFEVSESMYRPSRRGGSAESAGRQFSQSTGDQAVDSRIQSVQMMTPDEYLQQAYEATDARMGGSFEGWMASNQRNADDVARYADAMKSGDEFPMPYIDFDAGSQDGRNRALAAKAAGIEQIPVGIVPAKTSAQRIPEIMDELKDAKGYRKFKLEAELEKLKNEVSSNP